MAKIVVVYHSYRGVTPKLVEAFKKGSEKGGAECKTLLAESAKPEDLLEADTIVFAGGQPFNSLAGPVKTFLEHCWNYEGKKQFACKKYATILNGGAKDPSDVAAYLDAILPYFKLEKAAEGITCMANDLENALVDCEKLGEKLAR